ncbi:MAG TPA: phage holin family protein [Caulobacteraceae bacterium]|jgi:putative membrane protein|nr:phage holin family protein [Caulobacteraceae bacterium]
MARFLLRVLVAAAGLWLAARIVPGIHVSSLGSLAAAAILLGLVNALVRPIVVFLTLPFTIVTLGLFLLVVNAAMLELVAMMLRGFSVHGFGAAILGSIVISLVSWAASMFEPKPVYVRERPSPSR